MKYCSHCGRELYDEAVICPSCGCSCGNISYSSYSETRQSEGSLSPLSLVGFILSFFIQIVGFICSIIAYKNAVQEGDTRSKNFAKAGIIICSVIFGLYALYFFAIIAMIVSLG